MFHEAFALSEGDIVSICSIQTQPCVELASLTCLATAFTQLVRQCLKHNHMHGPNIDNKPNRHEGDEFRGIVSPGMSVSRRMYVSTPVTRDVC